jgi:hypothetical protein
MALTKVQSGVMDGGLNLSASAPDNTLVTTSAGNVGIGTSNPSLTSFDATTRGVEVKASTTYGGVKVGGTTGEFYLASGGGSAWVWNRENSPMIFATNATERMRITSSGDLLVNTTTTGSYMDGKLNVQATSTSPAICAKLDPASGNPVQFVYSAWSPFNTGNNIFFNMQTETSPTIRGTIDYNRGAGQVRYNTTSDATLKNLIGDSDKQKSVEILGSTRIREYAWKEDAEQKPQIGVIAQELYETYKGAVTVGGDVEKTDEEGNVTTQYNPWGVDKTAFTFHLIAGWQEHQRIIQEQQAIITDLKARIETLEAK